MTENLKKKKKKKKKKNGENIAIRTGAGATPQPNKIIQNSIEINNEKEVGKGIGEEKRGAKD
jgi:hypothetical protein